MSEKKQSKATSKSASLVEIDCPICASKNARELFKTKDYKFACSDEDFSVRLCRQCGSGYLSPRPAEHAMADYYPSDFYWYWEGADKELSWEELISARKRQLEQKFAWLSDLPPGRLLDIGTQKGEFLWYMREKGWDVEGAEIDNSVPNPAGLPIRYGDFLNMDSFEDETFDAITLWAVLEHVYEPAAFVQRACRLLKPGGRLVALITNINSVQARFYKADDYPRHLTMFSKKSVEWVCRDAGLAVDVISTDQKLFGGGLAGGLVYGTKRMFGYSKHEALQEWKQIEDADRFWVKWRGRPSGMMKFISRVDRALSLPAETVLDGTGNGFIMTFQATKIQN